MTFGALGNRSEIHRLFRVMESSQILRPSPDGGHFIPGWVPNKYLPILTQIEEAINIVLSTEDGQQDTQVLRRRGTEDI